MKEVAQAGRIGKKKNIIGDMARFQSVSYGRPSPSNGC